MMMMALLTGRERTSEQFEQLFAAAGLTLTRVTATASYSSMAIMEVAPRPDQVITSDREASL
ncbi:hypothetical protein AB0H00_14190 [Nocardia sp. NPDC023852]|uniref:hypothetical protein n=1 Tax=Nocardia sp. NPDC023852 TaxID=3154697 RepID=UPI0033D1F163